MSKTSSPGRTYYDPDFTAEITSRMHVPDKISVIEGRQNAEIPSPLEDLKSYMHVPERILVAGDNKHISGREPLPEMRLEPSLTSHLPNYVLATPPNILTVDEYPYPTVDLQPLKKERKIPDLDRSLISSSEMNESVLNSSCTPEEEVAILRRQVRHLSRRVLAVEQDNQQRQQREIIMYSLGVIYFVFKGIVWLHRHF